MKARSLKLFVCGIVLASATGACLAAADTAPAANAPQSVAEILQFQHALRDKLEARSGEFPNSMKALFTGWKLPKIRFSICSAV
jgi:hypothetical protein